MGSTVHLQKNLLLGSGKSSRFCSNRSKIIYVLKIYVVYVYINSLLRRIRSLNRHAQWWCIVTLWNFLLTEEISKVFLDSCHTCLCHLHRPCFISLSSPITHLSSLDLPIQLSSSNLLQRLGSDDCKNHSRVKEEKPRGKSKYGARG